MSAKRKTKSLSNPADRKIPVNISMPIILMDRVNDEAFKEFGLTSGARSKLVVKVLKEHYNME